MNDWVLVIVASLQLSYLISAWARMCKILGEGFKDYLPLVMPPVLKVACIKPEVALLDGLSIHFVSFATPNIGLHWSIPVVRGPQPFSNQHSLGYLLSNALPSTLNKVMCALPILCFQTLWFKFVWYILYSAFEINGNMLRVLKIAKAGENSAGFSGFRT